MEVRIPCNKAFRLILTLVFLCAFPAVALAEPKQPQIDASGAVLMEATTGRVLMGENADKKLPMASTTKIMTALLAVEKGKLGDVITVSPRASGVEGSSMYLEVGEKITLENLLYGLMLASGNDAAVAIAEHIGGSVEGFAEMMNARAREIGAKNTNFVTPNGLDDPEHYTTAYDLALIACEAMKSPEFAAIVSTQYRDMPWEGHQWNRSFKNKNKIIFNFEGGNGVKTGFTKRAGRCLVSAAKRGDLQLVSVVLNCGGMFPESMELLDYGFSICTMQTLVKKGELLGTVAIDVSDVKGLEIRAPRDIMVPLLEGEAERVKKKFVCEPVLTAPVKKGDVVAKLGYDLDGQTIAYFEFKAPRDFDRTDYRYYLGKVIEKWSVAGAAPEVFAGLPG